MLLRLSRHDALHEDTSELELNRNLTRSGRRRSVRVGDCEHQVRAVERVSTDKRTSGRPTVSILGIGEARECSDTNSLLERDSLRTCIIQGLTKDGRTLHRLADGTINQRRWIVQSFDKHANIDSVRRGVAEGYIDIGMGNQITHVKRSKLIEAVRLMADVREIRIIKRIQTVCLLRTECGKESGTGHGESVGVGKNSLQAWRKDLQNALLDGGAGVNSGLTSRTASSGSFGGLGIGWRREHCY